MAVIRALVPIRWLAGPSNGPEVSKKGVLGSIRTSFFVARFGVLHFVSRSFAKLKSSFGRFDFFRYSPFKKNGGNKLYRKRKKGRGFNRGRSPTAKNKNGGGDIYVRRRDVGRRI